MVSIIIPYYNVETYISQCLKSVMSQSYPDIEVLLVDDGSSDSSSAIIDKMLSDYHGSIQFRVIHQGRNLGVSAARNRGIHESKGEFLFFLDSDDYISTNCIELLVSKALTDCRTEMVMGNVQQVPKTYDWHSFYIPNPQAENIISYACSYQIYTMPWNKLVKRNFIVENALFFEQGLCHEDDLWSFQVACKLHYLSTIPEKTYFYVIHDNSLQTNSSFEFHYTNNTAVRTKMIQYVFENGLNSNTEIYHFLTHDLYQFVFDGISHHRTDLVSHFLKELRTCPHWSYSFVFKNSTLKDSLYSLYRYVPHFVEIQYFKAVNWLFLHIEKKVS